MSKRRVYLARCTECGQVAGARNRRCPHFGWCWNCNTWRDWAWQPTGDDPSIYGLTACNYDRGWTTLWIREYARA